MKNNLGYARFAVLVGSASIIGGMSLQDIVEFAPVIGWLSGFVFFLIATLFASRASWQKKRSL